MLFFFTFYIINSHFITCTNILIILILKSKIFTTQSHITRFTGAAFVGCNFKKISIIKEKAKYSHFNHTLITGFHRPLRVVPPTTTASPQPPPSYSARTPYFPSHFFPEKLHHYWQYYQPRIPGKIIMKLYKKRKKAPIFDSF